MTQRLYATTPANDSVQEIDPFTGTLLRSLFAWAASRIGWPWPDTGLHLYVGLDGSAQVVRVSLATFTEDLRFALGNDPFVRPPTCRGSMAVQPVTLYVLAVVRSRRDCDRDGRRRHLRFGRGVRPVIVHPRPVPVTELEFSTSTPSRLYGYNDLSLGVRLQPAHRRRLRRHVERQRPTACFEGYSTDIRFDNGPHVRQRRPGHRPRRRGPLLGTIPLGRALSGIVAPNSAIGAVHFVTLARFQPRLGFLRGFDPATFLQVDEDALTGVTMPSARALSVFQPRHLRQ